MKLILRGFLVTAILGIFVYLGSGIFRKAREKKNTESAISRLPNFKFKGIDGAVVTNGNLSGKPLWLIFFDTSCEYCQMEAENIRNAGNLDDMQIWLVSTESVDTLARFSNRYKLNSLTHLQLLNDSSHAGATTFHVSSSPASFLYRSDGSLVKQYKGVVKVETVLNDLRK